MNSQDTEFYKTLGKKLRFIRKQKGLSHTYISQIIGVSHQQYNKYERGINRIPLYQFLRLCKVLEVNPSSLLREFAWEVDNSVSL